MKRMKWNPIIAFFLIWAILSVSVMLWGLWDAFGRRGWI